MAHRASTITARRGDETTVTVIAVAAAAAPVVTAGGGAIATEVWRLRGDVRGGNMGAAVAGADPGVMKGEEAGAILGPGMNQAGGDPLVVKVPAQGEAGDRQRDPQQL